MSQSTLFGPPGTGKTTTLSKWAQQASAKYGGENIMICSLTRTAAHEIRSRDTDVPEHNVGTLHAHAYRSLEDVEVMGKEAIGEWNESYPHWTIPNRGFGEGDDVGVSSGESPIARYDLMRALGHTKDDLPPGLLAFASAYEQYKEAHGLIDFTDMISHATDHVDCPVDYIIMDEAQDCSALEFRLLKKWASQCKGAVIAGDDDQAAYEWRGASVDAFLNFSKEQRVLGQSYRLPAKVKARADSWIRQIKNRKPKTYEPKPGDPGLAVELDIRKPEEVVDHMLQQKGSSMVLGTCGYMMNSFVLELKKRAEPFSNPYRVRGDFASTWNPLLSGRKGTSTASDSVRCFLSPPWTWMQAHLWMRELKDLPRGTKKQLETMKSQKETRDELCPLEWLSTVLGETGLMAALSSDLDWFTANLKNDKRRKPMMLFRARVGKKHGVEAFVRPPKIIVGTIHSVKGGQSDNVYLLPDMSAKGKEAWQVNATHDPIIRQFYIGMTRAKQRLFLLAPQKYGVIKW